LVVFGLLAALLLAPAAVAGWPVHVAAIEPSDLAARIEASASRGYSGYVESTGRMGLPDIQGAGQAEDLLGGTSHLRIWYASPTASRLDVLSSTGETDTYADATGTWTWDSERRVAQRTEDTAGPRLPAPLDVMPPELGRRMLAAASATELHPLAPARVAGHAAAGLRIVPETGASSIDHVDLWADASTGIVLRVDIIGKGSSPPALETHFLDVRLARPSNARVTFVVPPGARVDRDRDGFDIVQALERFVVTRPPATVGGLAKRSATDSAVLTYGSGFDVVAVIALPEATLDRFLPVTIVPVQRSWGEARVITTPLLNALAFTAGPYDFVVAGAVTLPELDRIAGAMTRAGGGAS
jgi:hypothetical protein